MTLLSRIGKAFMMPIALLPAMGLMLGIGATMQNPDIQAILPFLANDFWILLAEIMQTAGDVTFANLPLLFAIGVAMGLSEDSGVAALAGAIGFLIMQGVSGILSVSEVTYLDNAKEYVPVDRLADLPQAAFTTNLGIHTLNTGVFGGIIIGLLAALCYNKFKDVRFPEFLAFFSGPRFVPIVVSFASILVGIILAFIWPPIQMGILAFGEIVASEATNPLWIFVYGFIERALIPFGLHHIWYTPLWFTAAGGTYISMDGITSVEGDVAIWFQQYTDYVTYGSEQFFAYLDAEGYTQAGRFMSGKYPFMIFGLPAAALAMYHTAKQENKAMVKGILFSAALTSMLTGITEPIEFTFLFVAPILYVIHCIMAGLSFMIMYMWDVHIGMTFSGGLLDLFLYGILPGAELTQWPKAVALGLLYIPIYYFGFKFVILKWNLQTPGRGETLELTTRASYNAAKSGDSNDKNEDPNYALSLDIIQGLGGAENIVTLDACITRLRPSVKDASLVDEKFLKEQTGAAGVMFIGKNGVQVIYGGRSAQIKDSMKKIMNK